MADPPQWVGLCQNDDDDDEEEEAASGYIPIHPDTYIDTSRYIH